MRILEINSVPYGSTAKIMLGIAQVAEQNGHTVMMSSGYSYHPIKELEGKYVKIGGKIGKAMHIIATRITGLHGVFSHFATARFLRKVKKFKPDIIHLHNLHGWYINLPMLFNYIKKNNIRTIWTLHDCWAFTGHCPYFDLACCEKWKNGCYKCPQHKQYPATQIDRSKGMYKRKKKWFTGVPDMTIVTPSAWLAGLVKQSYLKEYPVRVINNGIDLSVFKPTENEIKKRYDCEDKKLLLGVAYEWGKRKGLDVFIELAKRLNNYKILLVGTDDQIDKLLPANIISIHRTQNQKELAEIYTAADIFINPTREENFPTVNIEALACGTPILTFFTGGSAEIIDNTCGRTVKKDDVDAMEQDIIHMMSTDVYDQKACLERAKRFDMIDKFTEYISLYMN